MAKIKTGKVEIPDEDFKDQSITAHISIRLPLDLVKALKKLSLTEDYEGRYQVLMRDVLSEYVQHHKSKKRAAV
jgi:metal-responsive CopG/Arc/MetJ family transcriptional regulator